MIRRFVIAALGLPVLLLGAATRADVLFAEDAVLPLELIGPIGELLRNAESRERQPMTLRVDGRDFPVDVQVRGKSRTQVCGFPPLRLYFDRDNTAPVFAGQHKLKLVTHCRKSGPAEVNLLEEYAAYQILEQLTPVGMRVRLVRMTYVDAEAKADAASLIRYAFLIESRREVAKRLNGRKHDAVGVSLASLNAGHAALVYIFEYLIGNTDWSLVSNDADDTCCHNMDLVDIDGEIFLLPYDFDLAGLVNAPYAKPDPSLRIRRVTKRRYRGYCTDRDSLAAALQHVVAQRQGIMDALRAVPDIPARDRKSLLKYVDGFFAATDDTEGLLQQFEARCL